MPTPRPWFEWAGQRHLLRDNGGVALVLACPVCGLWMNLDRYEVSLGPDGALTATPSVACPHPPCPWHVHVTAGIATP